MKPRIVVDTNLWIRALLGGPATLPVLEAWRDGRFLVLISQPLLEELESVAQRPRLSRRIDSTQAKALLEQLRWRGEWSRQRPFLLAAVTRKTIQSWQQLSVATPTPLFPVMATCGRTTACDSRCWSRG